MAHTVIGIFDSRTEADLAVDKLINNKFDRKTIDIAVPEASESRADMTDEHNTLGSKIGSYFNRIFKDKTDVLKWASAAQRGITLAVQTETMEQAELAATVLDACGALNIDESARILEDSMTREDRKYNLKEEKRDPNSVPLGDNFNTRKSPNLAAETERQVDKDSLKANPTVTVRTRIVETPVGEDYRIRDEETWIETPKHDHVDKDGNLHKES